MSNNEILWKQYQTNVELFKFYMDLVVKFNVFFYAVTGAIISFVLAQVEASAMLRWALALPLVMSLCFAVFFVYGAVLMRILRNETFELRDALHLRAAPDVGVLSVLLLLFAFIYLLVAIASTILLCRL
ncbi:hypothetical protein [Acidovorax sp.]|jgi:hypothetical protein|uniref:hypothetical protein n=1 Tax=Acidovorax sp. TaxID=1872122 RepID=UPI0025C2AAC2|nr:hypothetical protein [Acidovorax sp.]